MPLAGKIPFDRDFVRAMVEGVPVVDYVGGVLSETINEVWNTMNRL